MLTRLGPWMTTSLVACLAAKLTMIGCQKKPSQVVKMARCRGVFYFETTPFFNCDQTLLVHQNMSVRGELKEDSEILPKMEIYRLRDM